LGPASAWAGEDNRELPQATVERPGPEAAPPTVSQGDRWQALEREAAFFQPAGRRGLLKVKQEFLGSRAYPKCCKSLFLA
jgi:hypothetical protein